MNNKIIITVLVVIIIIGGIIGVGAYILKAPASVVSISPTGSVSEIASDYQAVFLDNGQVYFGKVSREGSQYVELRDIYYLQVGQTLEPASGSQQQSPDIALVKFGNELHGPTDEMRINRDHILLIEDLRSDSRVVMSINEFIKSQSKAK